ncbi:hypothetical protein Bbelb_066370 [Branchiostoma belcheri]|nr:hypothetical protein Bbelb_066370 [Branchiostoma belcheri]
MRGLPHLSERTSLTEAGHPLGGVLVISGLMVDSPWMGLCGLTGLFLATLTAVIFSQDKGCVESGGSGFNGLLTGLLLAALSRDPDWHGLTVLPVIVMAIMSTFLHSGLSGVLGKADLPALNMAFNIAVLVYTAAAGTQDSSPRLYQAEEQQLLRNQTANQSAADPIDWIRVVQAVPIAIGQCYGCGQAVSGGLISAGVLVSSPVVFYHCVIGAVLGIGTALILGVPLHWVYSGACAYNSVLGTAAVGGVFYVLTIRSHVLSLLCESTTETEDGIDFLAIRLIGLHGYYKRKRTRSIWSQSSRPWKT